MKHVSFEKSESEILKAVLEQSQTGLTIGEIRLSLKIIDKLEVGNFDFEDSEHDYMCSRFAQTKFVKVSSDLVLLADKLGI